MSTTGYESAEDILRDADSAICGGEAGRGVARRPKTTFCPSFDDRIAGHIHAYVLDAICAAAIRGVDVAMIFPKRNDSWIVAAASHGYYRRLLEHGVKIFEISSGEMPPPLSSKVISI